MTFVLNGNDRTIDTDCQLPSSYDYSDDGDDGKEGEEGEMMGGIRDNTFLEMQG